MAEYVSREYLLNEYDRQHQGPPGGARKIIVDAPAADVVEVRHESWIDIGIVWIDKTNQPDGISTMFCPACERYATRIYYYGDPTDMMNFCPSCGAKMDGGQDEAPTKPYDLLYEEGGANTT